MHARCGVRGEMRSLYSPLDELRDRRRRAAPWPGGGARRANAAEGGHAADTQREREREQRRRGPRARGERPEQQTVGKHRTPRPCAVLCGVGSSGVGYVSERQCIVHASCLPETIYDDTIIYMRIDMTGDSMASIDIPIPPLNAASLVPMIAKLHDALTQVVGLGGYSP